MSTRILPVGHYHDQDQTTSTTSKRTILNKFC
ncbi:unnamed protein product, partial [Adineta steineri]